MWAATIGLTVYSIAGMLGEDDKQAKAWGTAAASGIFAGKTAYSLFGPGGYFCPPLRYGFRIRQKLACGQGLAETDKKDASCQRRLFAQDQFINYA